MTRRAVASFADPAHAFPHHVAVVASVRVWRWAGVNEWLRAHRPERADAVRWPLREDAPWIDALLLQAQGGPLGARPGLVRPHCLIATVAGMPTDLEEFLARLTVKPTHDDDFTAICQPAWPGRAFGGQLAAQALQAAAHTIQDKQPWSLHVYFHAPVAALQPVDDRVERVKDGRTLATRREAIEQDGRLRASVTALFGVPGEGPSHQYQRPETVLVEELPPVERLSHPTLVPLDADLDALGYPEEALVELRKVAPQVRRRPVLAHDLDAGPAGSAR